MTDARAIFVKQALSLETHPSFVQRIGLDGGVVRFDIATDEKPFFRGRELECWFRESIIVPTMVSGKISGLPIFRAIHPSSLETAVSQGIDVIPTDCHWYGSSLSKALEYGGDYPSVLIIDAGCVARTFKQLPADAPECEKEEALLFSGSEPISTEDGRWLLYSRLPLRDARRLTAYEFSYVYYIPGPAKNALLGYIVFEGSK